MVGKRKKKEIKNIISQSNSLKNIISRILKNEKDKRIVLDLISSWIV